MSYVRRKREKGAKSYCDEEAAGEKHVESRVCPFLSSRVVFAYFLFVCVVH